MTMDKQLLFHICLSDAETEATTWSLADTLCIADQLEIEMSGITSNEQKWFKKKLHQQKMKWHSQYSEHFEIQVHHFSIMQCTLAGNILSKIVFISLQDIQTWYSIPKGV